MASAFVADFARMPAQRKVMVFVVIGVLLGLLYWKFAYKALDEDLEAAELEHDNKVATNRRLTAEIPAYEELRTHMARLKELIEKNQTALPSAPELPAFFETLQHKATESGVAIHRWVNRSEEPVESFIKIPIEVEVIGTFIQIKRFFASLIQRDLRPTAADDHASAEPERIVSIENLALINPEAKNREVELTAKFIAVTFRQEDKGQPPAGTAPAAPRPAAPVVPPPPLPSPGLPAGARARVENALEKGDAKDRKAAGAADATGTAAGAPAAPRPAPAAPRPAAGSDRLKGGL